MRLKSQEDGLSTKVNHVYFRFEVEGSRRSWCNGWFWVSVSWIQVLEITVRA